MLRADQHESTGRAQIPVPSNAIVGRMIPDVDINVLASQLQQSLFKIQSRGLHVVAVTGPKENAHPELAAHRRWSVAVAVRTCTEAAQAGKEKQPLAIGSHSCTLSRWFCPCWDPEHLPDSSHPAWRH
ncbi:hypothetical protein G6F57_017415 [Rhizopus arrhizus]|nr:hypothetical protein G6F57_017415 [Rhizopus arrhizus]